MKGNPQNFKSLFKFYYDIVKPLYASVSADNILPQEVLFEINAAFDHISRKWQYNEDEKEVIEKAYGHLKRSVLDIFKIRVKRVHEQFAEMTKYHIGIIDNGTFEQELRKLFQEIKTKASEARIFEGQNKNDQRTLSPDAFDKWYPVYELCLLFEKEFYYSEKIDWGKIRGKKFSISQMIISFIAGIFSSLIASVIWTMVIR